MRAIVLAEYGPPANLKLGDVPEPTPGPGEIKVRVAATSLNPIDWKLRSGHYHAFMPLTLPAVLGRDVAGTVVAVGPGVTAPVVGAKVIGLVNRAYADFVVAPGNAFAELPAGLDLVDAAALPLVLLTGAQLIEDAAQVREGESVLVTGATGSVGRVAVYAARARGAIVYAGVRGAHADAAAKLDARGVIALDDDRQIESLPPLDVLADTVGGAPTQKVLDKLKHGARIGSVVGEPAGARERGLDVRAFLAKPDARRLGELAAVVAAGKLVVPIGARLPLAQAAEAHALAEKGGVGKILLTM
ncbi:MAG TPA: NADP-dependent oxidoreductase [Polyangia bacterium]|nr:NADP-dependent oxidoreductase [Polyangia bacterium]